MAWVDCVGGSRSLLFEAVFMVQATENWRRDDATASG